MLVPTLCQVSGPGFEKQPFLSGAAETGDKLHPYGTIC